jgi:hypothetical protein
MVLGYIIRLGIFGIIEGKRLMSFSAMGNLRGSASPWKDEARDGD